MANKNTPPAAPDFTTCPHWGKGGRFVVVDGKRVPEQEAPADGIDKTPIGGDTLPAETTTTAKGTK